MASIIPGIVSDASNLILTFCNAVSLIQLSGVNREAFQSLSNGAFFKELYSERHPHLRSFPKLFTVLRSHHLSNCWKVLCQILDPDWLQKGFNLPAINNRFPNKVSPAFIKEAIPHALAALKEEKKHWQEKYRNICASYYADPNSSLYSSFSRAWKEYAESGHLTGPLQVYRNLEKQKKECESNIEQIDEQIGDYLQSPENTHLWKIEREWEKGLGLEQMIENKLQLENCVALINQLIAFPQENPEALGKIRSSINACKDECRIMILRGLYLQCAKGVIEDSWAEYHFQDFLPELKIIIDNQLQYAQYKIGSSQIFN